MPSEGVPKCKRCRRDHKKCSPENRQWPGTKCDRCENYGYECSENLMARRSSQKGMDASRSTGRLVDGYSHSRYYGCHSTVSRSLAVRQHIPTTSTMQQQAHYQSPWAGLFNYLRDIDWPNLTCNSSALGAGPFAAMFRSPTCPVPDLSATPLGQRLMYLEAFAQSQRLMQDSPDSSANFLAVRLQRGSPRITMMLSFDELTTMCANYIRYGSYWNVFRAALQTDEVLLIDPSYSFDTDTPKTTFESAKQIWLCPDLGLKQFCQKLSGLSQMISDLARTGENSEERAFLASKIPDRVEEVLGPRMSPNTVSSYTTPFFPTDIVTSSPVEMTEGDIYSPSDSAGADTSDDGFSLDGRGLQTILGNALYSEANIWGT